MAYPNELRLDAVEYYREGLSGKEVIGALAADGNPDLPGVSTLHAWLRDAGFSRKRGGNGPQKGRLYPTNTRDIAVDYYTGGASARETKRQLEYDGLGSPSTETILTWVRDAGGTVRSSGFERRGKRNPSCRHSSEMISAAVEIYRRGFNLADTRAALIRRGYEPSASVSTIARWVHDSDVEVRPAGRRRKRG